MTKVPPAFCADPAWLKVSEPELILDGKHFAKACFDEEIWLLLLLDFYNNNGPIIIQM